MIAKVTMKMPACHQPAYFSLRGSSSPFKRYQQRVIIECSELFLAVRGAIVIIARPILRLTGIQSMKRVKVTILRPEFLKVRESGEINVFD